MATEQDVAEGSSCCGPTKAPVMAGMCEPDVSYRMPVSVSKVAETYVFSISPRREGVPHPTFYTRAADAHADETTTRHQDLRRAWRVE